MEKIPVKIKASNAIASTLLCLLVGGFTTGCEKKNAGGAAAAPGVEDTKAIAEQGFIYGLPIVMNYAVMNEYVIDKSGPQYKAPFNQITNEHRVFTYQDTAIVTPNSDTPYSLAWLDLRAEPMVLSVPAVEKKRYYSVMLVDGNTYNFGYIGSRATGSEPGDYLVAGPDWKGDIPTGIKKVFASTTPFAMAVYRTQLFNPADMPNVQKVQSGYKAQPLSAYLKQPAPPAPPKIDFLPATTAGIKANFFEYLDAALQFIPPDPESKDIRAKLATIGVGPGKTFEFKDLSDAHKAAVLLGMKEGDDKVKKFLSGGIKNVNGWNIASPFGDRSFYNGNWLLRSAAATAGIYGNDAIEAAYPMTRVDDKGETLDGSKHTYTITFPEGQLPPVNAFWSVTLYDGKSQLLVKNPINRYLINSPMMQQMKKNPDGSLTLYIQKDSPGKANEANWLPAPDDTIYLVMRLYWPKETPPSVLPAGSGTWRPPPVVQAS